MKYFKTKLILSLFQSDLLLFKENVSSELLKSNINNFNSVLSSIKQLTKIIECNQKIPLFIVCQNKQYSMLIKKYIIFSKRKDVDIFLVTYKTAVTLKVPAIYFIIECENSNSLCLKIQKHSNSIIYLIEKNHLNKKSFGEYIMNLNIICVKQILFILTLVKKIKKITNEKI